MQGKVRTPENMECLKFWSVLGCIMSIKMLENVTKSTNNFFNETKHRRYNQEMLTSMNINFQRVFVYCFLQYWSLLVKGIIRMVYVYRLHRKLLP